eukprot:746552-Hanusia_phi.AAC.2
MPAALDLDLGMDPRRKNFFCNYCGYETYWSPAFSRHEKECQWKKILDGKEDSIPQNSSCPPASHVGRETMIGVGQLQQEGFDKKRTIPPPVLPQSIYDVPPASWEVQLAKAQLEAEAVEDSECTADSSSDFASNHAEKLGKLDLRCSLKHESRMDFKKMKSVYCSVKKSKKKKNAMLMMYERFAKVPEGGKGQHGVGAEALGRKEEAKEERDEEGGSRGAEEADRELFLLWNAQGNDLLHGKTKTLRVRDNDDGTGRGRVQRERGADYEPVRIANCV